MPVLRLAAVSYLNTKPFIYGLYSSSFGQKIDLSLDVPAVCAQKLSTGLVDIALCPVAVIPQLEEAYLVSHYCIGATGPVRTVCIFAEKPIHEIKKIVLDNHSKTSVMLTRTLCQEYWKINPEFVDGTDGFEDSIGGNTAALVIGDKAFRLHGHYPYVYDLAEVWQAWQNLPFVFAAWISTKPISETLVASFNDALKNGLDRLPELMKILPAMPDVDFKAYFEKHISYELDEPKWIGLNRFLNYFSGENGYNLRR